MKLSLEKNPDKNILVWPQPAETKQQSFHVMISVPERKGTKFKESRKEIAYIQYKKHHLESPIISVNI